ncbi:MAG: hypothetical protein ABL932_10650 [Terricaulis sp.]
MTEQKIIYLCTAVAALAVAIATPGPPTTIEAALDEDGSAFCAAAIREARPYTPSINWRSQRLQHASPMATDPTHPHRLTCVTESDDQAQITFEVVCPRADSDECVEIRSVTTERGGTLFETTSDQLRNDGATE